MNIMWYFFGQAYASTFELYSLQEYHEAIVYIRWEIGWKLVLLLLQGMGKTSNS